MKSYSLALLAAVLLLAGCNQTPPATEQPTAEAPASPAAADATAVATPDASAPATNEATPAAPAAAPAETLQASFSFKPEKDADNPGQHKSSAHLLLSGAKPQDIDLGRFNGKPDVVDDAKAKLAGFPTGMLMGFRSYDASSGTSSDLAVVKQGRRLRILQRRVDEQAAAPGNFEPAREIPLAENIMVVAAPVPAAPAAKK
jgi:hypothetical protein